MVAIGRYFSKFSLSNANILFIRNVNDDSDFDLTPSKSSSGHEYYQIDVIESMDGHLRPRMSTRSLFQ